MKLTVDRGDFSRALDIASKVISNKATLPVLANILFEVIDGKLRLTATDLDSSVMATIPVEAPRGAVPARALPAAILSDYVGKLGSAKIDIELGKDAKAIITGGKSQQTLLSVNGDDFPVVPSEVAGISFSMTQAALKNTLSRTLFSCSREETRSILMGALWEIQASGLTVVGTDTHRMSVDTVPVSNLRMDGQDTTVFKGKESCIVPAKPLFRVNDILVDTPSDNAVRVAFGKDFNRTAIATSTLVRVEVGNVVYISRQLDGQFPNYEKVIPKAHDKELTFKSSELLSALRRVFIVARQNSEKVHIKLRRKDEIVVLSAECQDVGTAMEEVPVELVCNDDATFDDQGNFVTACNCRYLMDVLGALKADKVVFRFSGPLNPATIRGQGMESFTHVVMPMQV